MFVSIGFVFICKYIYIYIYILMYCLKVELEIDISVRPTYDMTCQYGFVPAEYTYVIVIAFHLQTQ
jgi:hypothetical protein